MTAEDFIKERFPKGGANVNSLFGYDEVIRLMNGFENHQNKKLIKLVKWSKRNMDNEVYYDDWWLENYNKLLNQE